ncbi:MAG: hypothetical protein JST93_28165 [Acidobacteria bacterium]|nr:hypothetical protein [Acidobacteriota bacterium]
MRLMQIAFAFLFTGLLFAQEPIPPKSPKRQPRPQQQRDEDQDRNRRIEERRRKEQSERMTNVYADTATRRYYRSRCNGSAGLIMMSLWDAKQQGLSGASCKDRKD